uniref:Uncharacterized protein n=1 Tax=Arundo donax TaxID=35708 RepID=A0A0A8YGC9_ARUDO
MQSIFHTVCGFEFQPNKWAHHIVIPSYSDDCSNFKQTEDNKHKHRLTNSCYRFFMNDY